MALANSINSLQLLTPTANVQHGSLAIGYSSTLTPTNSIIVSGQFSVGASTITSGIRSRILAASTDYTVMSTAGDLNGLDGTSSQFGWVIGAGHYPTSNASSCYSFHVIPAFSAQLGNTITSARVISILSDLGGNQGTISQFYGMYITDIGGAGTITAATNLRIDLPSFGTTKICAAFGGNVSIGSSYVSTAAPTDGLIIQGQTSIGINAPNASDQLTVHTSLGRAILVQGTQTGQDSEAKTIGIGCRSTMNPGDGSTIIGINSEPIIAMSAGTGANFAAAFRASSVFTGNAGGIATYYGFYYDGGAPLPAGSLTFIYGAYISVPVTGTNRIALFATNQSVGASYATSVPPTNGLIVQGRMGLGTSSATYYLDVVPTSTSDGIRVKGSVTNLQLILNNSSGTTGSRSFSLTNNSGFTATIFQLLSDADAFSSNLMGVFSNAGLSVGSSYATTTPPANGLIVQGQVAIGNPAAGVGRLYIHGASTDTQIVAYDGTTTAVDGGTNSVGLYGAPVFNPTNGGNLFATAEFVGSFVSPSTKTMASCSGIYIYNIVSGNVGTITNAYGIFIDSGSVGAGTITRGYGLYVTNPFHGTTKIATYTDNLSVGYTGTSPPSAGAIIQGRVYINQSSPAANVTASPLSISSGATGATPGVAVGMVINSSDAVNAIELAIGMYGSATAAQQGGYIEALVPGFNYSPLYIGPNNAGVAFGTASLASGAAIHVNAPAGSLSVFSSSNGGANNETLQFRTAYASASNPIIGSIICAPDNTGGRLIFSTARNSTGTLTEAMRIDSLQNVGIGVAGPGRKLDVRVTTSDTAMADILSVGGNFQGANDGTTRVGLIVQPALQPTFSGTITSVFNTWLYPNFAPGSGCTITNGCGLYIDSGAVGGAGTTSNSWSLYVNIPAYGTTKNTAFFGGTTAGMTIEATGILYPTGNKTLDIGKTGARFNTMYNATNTTGTSRLAPSQKLCPTCSERMVRGTGTIIILGESADFLPCWCDNELCKDFGHVHMDKIKHLPPARLSQRVAPPKIEFLGFKVCHYSGNSRGIQVKFRYMDKLTNEPHDGHIENSSFLSDYEYEQYLLMSPTEKESFILAIGQREWDALEENRLMENEITSLETQLNANVSALRNTNLLLKK